MVVITVLPHTKSRNKNVRYRGYMFRVHTGHEMPKSAHILHNEYEHQSDEERLGGNIELQAFQSWIL